MKGRGKLCSVCVKVSRLIDLMEDEPRPKPVVILKANGPDGYCSPCRALFRYHRATMRHYNKAEEWAPAWTGNYSRHPARKWRAKTRGSKWR